MKNIILKLLKVFGPNKKHSAKIGDIVEWKTCDPLNQLYYKGEVVDIVNGFYKVKCQDGVVRTI